MHGGRFLVRMAASAASAAFCLAGSSGASAEIIDHGTYFTDTLTGLDWLNNQPLAGQSFNSVLAGYGGYTTSGWRYATAPELVSLVNAYVGPLPTLDSTNSWTAYNYAPGAYQSAYSLIESLGINVAFGAPPDPRATRSLFSTDLTGIATQGWFDDGDASNGVGVFDFAAYYQPADTATPFAMTQVIPNLFSPNDFHGSNVSAILVRYETIQSPAPEPETYAMTLAGLGLIALAVRRRKWPSASMVQHAHAESA